jgi:hypothetical protein
MRPVSVQASAQPTSTGTTLIVNVCGRDATTHARGDEARRAAAAGAWLSCVCMARLGLDVARIVPTRLPRRLT